MKFLVLILAFAATVLAGKPKVPIVVDGWSLYGQSGNWDFIYLPLYKPEGEVIAFNTGNKWSTFLAKPHFESLRGKKLIIEGYTFCDDPDAHITFMGESTGDIPANIQGWFSSVPGVYNHWLGRVHPTSENYWWKFNAQTITANCSFYFELPIVPQIWGSGLGCPGTSCNAEFEWTIDHPAQVGMAFSGRQYGDMGIKGESGAKIELHFTRFDIVDQ